MEIAIPIGLIAASITGWKIHIIGVSAIMRWIARELLARAEARDARDAALTAARAKTPELR